MATKITDIRIQEQDISAAFVHAGKRTAQKGEQDHLRKTGWFDCSDGAGYAWTHPRLRNELGEKIAVIFDSAFFIQDEWEYLESLPKDTK